MGLVGHLISINQKLLLLHSPPGVLAVPHVSLDYTEMKAQESK